MFDSVIGVKHLVATWLVVAACGGGSGGDGEVCASIADCEDGLACAGVNDGPVCGIAPREECASDAECFGGSVCQAVLDPCSADGIGSACEQPCNGDADCGETFTCDAGHCIAVPCDAGFMCAGREACEPSRITSATPVFDRHHGCFAVACSTDDECGERFCVNGTCQDDTGSCVEPLAVP
jgi:hypothetical protein